MKELTEMVDGRRRVVEMKNGAEGKPIYEIIGNHIYKVGFEKEFMPGPLFEIRDGLAYRVSNNGKNTETHELVIGDDYVYGLDGLVKYVIR